MLACTLGSCGDAGDSDPVSDPTLGAEWPINAQEGFGEVRPAVIYLGGVGNGRVWDIAWDSWGDPVATGTGTGYFAESGMTVDSFEEPATVLAFDLGECDGVPSYRAVTWFFPEQGESYDTERRIGTGWDGQQISSWLETCPNAEVEQYGGTGPVGETREESP